MTPLVRKEIRLLLPFFGIALFLAAVPAWFLPEGHGIPGAIGQFVFWIFGFGVVLLSLAPFGQEFSLNTFSLLLAQPSERRRIWTVKTVLVLIASLLVLLAFVISVRGWCHAALTDYLQALHDRAHYLNRMKDLPELEASARQSFISLFWQTSGKACLVVLVVATGGLWATLLLRQTAAALWSAILVPGIILVAVQLGTHTFSETAQQAVAIGVLSVYSIAGFVWARRMFMAAQDAQWLGDTISVSGLSSSKAQTESAQARRRKPLRALLRKEFQLQQINLLIAFGLLVVHLCTLASRGFYEQPRNSQLRFILEAIPFLWSLLPWLLGSAAVAEERKLGTLESQLCLPAMRRLQFAVKFCLAMVLGIVLGAVMPWILERVGLLFHIPSSVISTSGSGPSAGQALLMLCQIAAAIALLSFFASTLTRNTLQALGVAILVVSVWFGLAVQIPNSYSQDLFLSILLRFGLPTLIALLLWRSYNNFKHLTAGWRLFLENGSVLLFVMFLVYVMAAFFAQQIGYY